MSNNKASNLKNIYILFDIESISVFVRIYEKIFFIFNKEKINIHFININFKKKNKNYLEIYKKKFRYLKIFQPNNTSDLKNYILKEKGVIFKNYVDLFNYYKINYTLKKINFNIVEIANLGNVQQSEFYYIKKNIHFLKKLFFYYFPKKLSLVLYNLGLFKKISIRFESNYKIYKSFKKNKKKNLLFKKYSKYLKMINVKSIIFEKFGNKKFSNKYITLLEFDPSYIEEKRSKKHSKKNLDDYYLKMNKILKQIKKIFNKEVVICIHPLYDLDKIQKRYKNFRVFKHKTEEFVKNSEIVMFFDSSSIMEAIFLRKKILSLRSKLYQGNKNKSNLYSDVLKTYTLDIDSPTFYNKNKFLKFLNKRIKNYEKFLKLYGSSQAKYGYKKIIDEIKKL